METISFCKAHLDLNKKIAQMFFIVQEMCSGFQGKAALKYFSSGLCYFLF